jgi:hypothetical protein
VAVYFSTKVPMLVSRQFDDEIILANFETGIYYSLVGSAADVWLGLGAGMTADEMAAVFAPVEGESADGIRQQVADFVDKLRTEKIVIPYDGLPERQPWSPQFSNPFTQPMLDFFDDLRDLLFLDPVHDVSEAGWPIKASDDV